ncbi:GATA zinc finger domain-containing protein 4-like [Chenopodium quinoa]|uniref:GATA zinc finger domain-containing protein 4-like n=1 Tax=Chenopodium quinoa TaxID=63459 RepID=UPI000B775A2B|nr:GATA zinc finger domain-containing protein 4-like [Chenopodium quinoa]
MGDMSISKYYNKFMTLSRFSPEVVPTEELKAHRFEHGLTDELQQGLAGKVFKSLDEVYERVAHLYHLNTRTASASAKAGEKRKDFGKSENQSNSKRPRNWNSFDRGNQNVSSSSNANNGERTYLCKRCRRNHPERDCDGNLVTCRFYNKRGHKEYECYTKRKQQGNGGNGGNTQQRPNNFNNQGNRGNGYNGKFGNGSNNNNKFGNGNNNNSGNNNGYQLNLTESSHVDVSVSLPTGKLVHCNKIFKGLPLKIGEAIYPSNLIEFNLGDLDVILGMDWLSLYKAKIDCEMQRV